MTEVNVEMFRRIREQIEREPQNFGMSYWIAEFAQQEREFYNVLTDSWEDGSCGTTRCVAGWAVHFEALDKGLYGADEGEHDALFEAARSLVGAKPYRGDTIEKAGAKVLGIDLSLAHVLFHTDDVTAYRAVELFSEGRSVEAERLLGVRDGS